MSEALRKLTVVKERQLSNEVGVRVTLRFGEQHPLVEWQAPPSRPISAGGVRELTDAEAHQYGIVVGETYADFARITGTVLGYATDARCGAGLSEGGAEQVEYKGGAAFAIFGKRRVESPGGRGIG